MENIKIVKNWKEEYYKLLKNNDLNSYSKALEIKRENIPRYLYRYRVFDGKNINRIRREIHGFVFLTCPNAFNDIYDTKSIINMGKEKFFENLKEAYKVSLKKHFDEIELDSILKHENWFDEMLIKGLINENYSERVAIQTKEEIKNIINSELIKINQTFNDSLVEQLRIACFTESCTNLPMGYHYADKYAGYCIEYDTSTIKEILYINKLLPVNYVTDYKDIIGEIIKRTNGNESLAGIQDEFAITKIKDWSYEKEWRLVLTLGDLYPSDEVIPQVVKDKGIELFIVKPIKIIVGPKMLDENIELLKRECIKIDVKIARLKASDNGIIIEE